MKPQTKRLIKGLRKVRVIAGMSKPGGSPSASFGSEGNTRSDLAQMHKSLNSRKYRKAITKYSRGRSVGSIKNRLSSFAKSW